MNVFGLLGTASALVSIVAGSFAAHGLDRPPELLHAIDTGARYEMYHALVLLLLTLLPVGRPGKIAGWLFVAGTTLFSGSLYLFGLTGQRWLGAITPVGGLCFLVGWSALGVGFLQQRRTK